jgi:hypothetical protein
MGRPISVTLAAPSAAAVLVPETAAGTEDSQLRDAEAIGGKDWDSGVVIVITVIIILDHLVRSHRPA